VKRPLTLMILALLAGGCVGRKPAAMPKSVAPIDVVGQVSRAEKAALEASESAAACQRDSEDLKREIQSLKQMLLGAQSTKDACDSLVTKAEKRIRAREAQLRKKEEEAKAAAEAALQVQPKKVEGIPEYSKSDAPL